MANEMADVLPTCFAPDLIIVGSYMSRYYFRALERDGHIETSEAVVELSDDAAALVAARTALAEMAAEGLPDEAIGMMAIEVLDENQDPIYEIRLTIDVVPKRQIIQQT